MAAQTVVMAAVSVLLLVMTWVGSWCAGEDLDWEQYRERLRKHTAPPAVALYFGAAENRLASVLHDAGDTARAVPVVMIPARAQYSNPLGGRDVGGADLQRFFGVTAGTLVFLDQDGMPLPQLTMPQALHGNDAQLVRLYFAFIAGRHDRSMDIAEYAQALGQQRLLAEAIDRERQGQVRLLDPRQHLVAATTAVGAAVVDPWAIGGVFYLYAHAGEGRVLCAQLREITRGFSVLRPRLTVITPVGEDPDPAWLESGAECVLAHAARGDLRLQGPSPLLVVSARTERGMQAMRLDGFQPAPVLAQLLGLQVTDASRLEHDIPYGEVDEPQELPAATTPEPATATASGARGGAMPPGAPP